MPVKKVRRRAHCDQVSFPGVSAGVVEAKDEKAVKALVDPNVARVEVRVGNSEAAHGEELLQQHLQDGDTMPLQEVFPRHEPLELVPWLGVCEYNHVVILVDGDWSLAAPQSSSLKQAVEADFPEYGFVELGHQIASELFERIDDLDLLWTQHDRPALGQGLDLDLLPTLPDLPKEEHRPQMLVGQQVGNMMELEDLLVSNHPGDVLLSDVVGAVDEVLLAPFEEPAEHEQRRLLSHLEPGFHDEEVDGLPVGFKEMEVHVLPDEVELVLVIVRRQNFTDLALEAREATFFGFVYDAFVVRLGKVPFK
jgi:hypothetical protein